jgi:hypothetical protein
MIFENPGYGVVVVVEELEDDSVCASWGIRIRPHEQV